jgi:hypothetical protein
MMSVARYLTDISYPGEIFFLFGARTTEDFIFREELEYLERRHVNLHVAATMSRAPGTVWMGPEGLISKEFIAHAVPEISRRHVHLCGPPPMMEAVKGELAELGVPKEQVETEAFGPAEGMAPADSLESAHPAEAALPATPAPPPPAGAIAGRGERRERRIAAARRIPDPVHEVGEDRTSVAEPTGTRGGRGDRRRYRFLVSCRDLRHLHCQASRRRGEDGGRRRARSRRQSAGHDPGLSSQIDRQSRGRGLTRRALVANTSPLRPVGRARDRRSHRQGARVSRPAPSRRIALARTS